MVTARVSLFDIIVRTGRLRVQKGAGVGILFVQAQEKTGCSPGPEALVEQIVVVRFEPYVAGAHRVADTSLAEAEESHQVEVGAVAVAVDHEHRKKPPL
jgi:hypothetical protein